MDGIDCVHLFQLESFYLYSRCSLAKSALTSISLFPIVLSKSSRCHGIYMNPIIAIIQIVADGLKITIIVNYLSSDFKSRTSYKYGGWCLSICLHLQ